MGSEGGGGGASGDGPDSDRSPHPPGRMHAGPPNIGAGGCGFGVTGGCPGGEPGGTDAPVPGRAGVRWHLWDVC